MTIFSVFIDDGCITCDACEEAAPDIFEVTEDTCFIKPDVRTDGGYDRDVGKSGLKPEVVSSLSDDIFDAADACPVDVIIVVEGTGEEEPEPEEEPVTKVLVAVAPEESVEVLGDDLDSLLTTGDRSLNILFGSQSGNSEELAAKFAKQAIDYGLVPPGTHHGWHLSRRVSLPKKSIRGRLFRRAAIPSATSSSTTMHNGEIMGSLHDFPLRGTAREAERGRCHAQE